MDGWTLSEATPEATPGRDLTGVLVRRERTACAYGGVAFEFARDVESRNDAGLITQVRLTLREVPDARGHATASPYLDHIVVRPVLPARTLRRMSPWERTALRQAARTLLRRAAAHARADGTGENADGTGVHAEGAGENAPTGSSASPYA